MDVSKQSSTFYCASDYLAAIGVVGLLSTFLSAALVAVLRSSVPYVETSKTSQAGDVTYLQKIASFVCAFLLYKKLEGESC